MLAAQKLLEKYNVAADVWSVTSYQELYRDGHACDRWNMLHPARHRAMPYIAQCLKDAPGVLVAASDYLKVLPDSIDQWMPRRMRSLGTDGFGRSEDRQRLRDFFEVDARFVVLATLAELAQEGQLDRKVVAQAIKDLGDQPGETEPGEELDSEAAQTHSMPTDFTLPELGENITAGDVVRVLVSPGDSVAKDQAVLELETDKATIEVPSSVAGTVKDIRVKQGERIKVGQVVLTLDSANASRGWKSSPEGRGGCKRAGRRRTSREA